MDKGRTKNMEEREGDGKGGKLGGGRYLDFGGRKEREKHRLSKTNIDVRTEERMVGGREMIGRRGRDKGSMGEGRC